MYKKTKKVEVKYIIFITIILVIGLLVLFSYILKDKKELSPVEKALKDVIITSQTIISYPFNYIIETINKFSNYNEILEEYELLKLEKEQSVLIMNENEQLKDEISNLLNILNIDYTITQYDRISARVIMRNNGYWYNTITINKGSYHGLEVDMAVTSNEGLIGKITNVSYLTSEVNLITTSDNSNNISCNILSEDNNYYGVIKSYDQLDNTLTLEGISNTLSIDENAVVMTSGLGGIYPSGILIGYIKEFSTDSYDLAKIIKVTPSADFNDINYVNVLVKKI